jgi:WD40 repeat protein
MTMTIVDRVLARFVGGTRTGLVRCWDPEGNRVMFDLEDGHSRAVDTVIAYRSSASGTTRLLTVSAEGTAKVWETVGDSGALVLTLEDGLRADEHDEKHTVRHACVFWGPTGSDRMAIGYASGTIRVWDGEAVRGSRDVDNVERQQSMHVQTRHCES